MIDRNAPFIHTPAPRSRRASFDFAAPAAAKLLHGALMLGLSGAVLVAATLCLYTIADPAIEAFATYFNAIGGK